MKFSVCQEAQFEIHWQIDGQLSWFRRPLPTNTLPRPDSSDSETCRFREGAELERSKRIQFGSIFTSARRVVGGFLDSGNHSLVSSPEPSTGTRTISVRLGFAFPVQAFRNFRWEPAPMVFPSVSSRQSAWSRRALAQIPPFSPLSVHSALLC